MAGMSQYSTVKDMRLNSFFRSTGNKVYIEVSLGGIFANMYSSLEQFNIEAFKLKGFGNASWVSGIKATDLLTCSYNEIIKNFTNFKFELRGEIHNLNLFVTVTGNMRQLFDLLNLLGAVNTMKFELKYDAKELMELIKSAVEEMAPPQITEVVWKTRCQ